MSLPMMHTLFDTYRKDYAQTDEERNVLTNLQVIYNTLKRYLDHPKLKVKFIPELVTVNSRFLSLVGFVRCGDGDRPSRMLALMTHHNINVDDITCLTRLAVIPDDCNVQADTHIIKENMRHIMTYVKTSKALTK